MRRLTQEQVAKKDQSFGLYSYDLYRGQTIPRRYVCNGCGKLYEAIPVHIWKPKTLSSCGCLTGKGKILSQEEATSRDIKSKFYSYSKYVKRNEKRKYVCRHCGRSFYTTPGNIWNGCTQSCGCTKKGSGSFTQKQATENDIAVGMYSYEKYISVMTKRRYVCSDCGKMTNVTPNDVWNNGVRRCGRKHETEKQKAKKKQRELREIEAQAEIVRKDKKSGFYSYTKYTNSRTKRRYICKHCGKTFLTTPKSVWAGKIKSCGCISSYTVRHTQDEVVKKDIAVNMFSYDIYEGQNEKRRYVCPLCGKMFLTTPKTVWNRTAITCGSGSLEYTEFRGVQCQECSPSIFVNGYRVSFVQDDLKKMVDKLLNEDGQHNVPTPYKDGKIVPDITYPEYNLIVEYDGWYWHKDTLKEDQEKTHHLMDLGWKILRVKSNALLPDIDILKQNVYYLATNQYVQYAEIVLSDWGENNG